MDEPTLPEDMARWPDDMFELLGVDRKATPKDAKRNYTRLIRVYKPELFPEHFRRLREAYEGVLRMIEMFERFGSPYDDSSPAATAETSPEPVSVHVDQASIWWERACEGNEADAYRGLRELYTSGETTLAISLRLYWLLVIDSSLDEDKSPCDYLIDAMRNQGVRGSAFELYRREILSDPEEALNSRFDELLTFQATIEATEQLYAWRWGAARQRNQLHVIYDDLPVARRRLFGSSDDGWLRLLMVATDAAAFDTGEFRELWTALESEVRDMEHLGTRHSDWFDQYEILAPIGTQWWKAWSRFAASLEPVVTPWRDPVNYRLMLPLLELVSAGWHNGIDDFREPLLKALTSLLDEPSGGLAALSMLRDSYPAVLQALMAILRYADSCTGMVDAASQEEIDYLTTEFVAQSSGRRQPMQELIISFCSTHWLDPIDLFQAVIEDRVAWQTRADTSDFIRLAQDGPVRLVCLAHRVLHQMR